MPFLRCGNAVHHYELRQGAPGAPEPALVFVNGLGTTHRIWDDVIGALRFRGSILRYDMRGHGLTDVGERPYSVASLSRDLSELTARLGLGSLLLCGLSLGGLVARELAVAEPERVRAAILCATALRIGTPEGWQSRQAAVRSGGLASISESVMERWFGAPWRARHADSVQGHRNMLERTPVEGYLAALEALERSAASVAPQGLVAPVLVVSGELDTATPPGDGEALAAHIPGARYCVLEGAGHLLCVEKAPELAAHIDAFLEGLG